ncbi:MAG: glycosyltransferase family 2 protein, partial [Luteibaculum sp.]
MSVKISIITVTYNAGKVLQRTLDSIRKQTRLDLVELILVDGNSKDQTLDIIKANTDIITQWVSEPDKGLYDAMNKGINMATGDYLWFMNAGDEIYDAQTIAKILPLLENRPDILYGETIEYSESGSELGMRRLKAPKKLTWKSFKMGMLVSHQSILIKR